MLYDAFICHASEDKDAFVRDLAQRLSENNVAVWYDEFSLRVGDSLRQSIDRGLSQSRFGIVVLSEPFFRKSWPQWELNGLVQRQLDTDSPVILPIWLNVKKGDVLSYSPTLADAYAISTSKGLDYVVTELLKAIRPQGSSLIVARDEMIAIGYDVPVVTDDWWHGAIEYCGSNPVEGTFQEPMGWGRWGFPLPPFGPTARERGLRIARAAMQIKWQRRAEAELVTQLTHPDAINRFISSTPGLKDVCFSNPEYLVSYAPQITIPGVGGDFEGLFDDWLAQSRMEYTRKRQNGSTFGTALTVDGMPPTCDDLIALHDPEFGNYKPPHIACSFVQGVLQGPPVRVFDYIDYIGWLLSSSSSWLPPKLHDYMITGMRDWAVWVWFGEESYTDAQPNPKSGSLFRAMSDAVDENSFEMTSDAEIDLIKRFEATKATLSLPESVKELVAKFRQARFVEAWIEKQKHRGESE